MIPRNSTNKNLHEYRDFEEAKTAINVFLHAVSVGSYELDY